MQKAHKQMPNVSQPAREILRLAGFRGCIFCGSGHDNIFWRLLVHCCTTCLHSNLPSQKQLWDNFALPAACFKDVPHRDVGRRNHKVMFYLYGDILPILQKYYGVSSFDDFNLKYNVEELKLQYSKWSCTMPWWGHCRGKHKQSRSRGYYKQGGGNSRSTRHCSRSAASVA